MSLIVRIVGLVDGTPSPVDGAYLVSCDVDARGGRGMVVGTEDPTKARRFADLREVTDYWKRTSTVDPIRADGKPNRPFTAYTIETVPIDGEAT